MEWKTQKKIDIQISKIQGNQVLQVLASKSMVFQVQIKYQKN